MLRLKDMKLIFKWTLGVALFFFIVARCDSPTNDYQAGQKYLEQNGLPPIQGRPGTGLPPQRR